MPTAPPPPQTNGAKPATVNPRLEYVAGGAPLPYRANGLRTLPHAFDENMLEFGDRVYDQVLKDANVNACVRILKHAILAQGLKITPTAKEGQPGYARAVEFAEFVERSLGRLRQLRTRTLPQLLGAMCFGNRVAEKVWDEVPAGVDKGRFVLGRLKVKPRRSYAFVMDAYMELRGLVAVIPGQTPTLPPIVDNPKQLLPADKFAIFSWAVEDEDPRGHSMLQCIYEPWWDKRQVRRERLKHLARFGSPSLVGEAAKDAVQYQEQDANGVLQFNSDGSPKMVTPVRGMYEALLAFQNGSVISIPNGGKVYTLEPQHTGSIWSEALGEDNREITLGLLLQALANQEGQHNARAAAETHQDVMGLGIQGGRNWVAALVREHLVEHLIRNNYGEDDFDLLPDVSLGDVEAQDIANMIKAFAALMTAGGVDPSQLQGMDAMMGLPIRTAEEVARREERAAAPPAPEPGAEQRPPADDSEGDEEDQAEDE